MQPLSCPIPSNINPLQSNGFMFRISKLPELSYFCQEVNLPELSLAPAGVSTPLVDTFYAGDKPTYGDLSVTFLIDEQMANYTAVHNWLVGIGFPESWAQFGAYVEANQQPHNPKTDRVITSDAVLQILNSSNNVTKAVQFIDCFPTGLQSITLQSTTSDTMYLAGVASFRYTLYKFI